MTGVDFPVGLDRVYMVAEAEINHNGDVDTALDMVRAAADFGADGIKFQYIVADEIAVRGTPFHDLFKGVELGVEAFARIRDLARDLGLDFFLTTPSPRSLPQVAGLEPRFVKIGSTNITNLPLLRGVADMGLPVILSTGASTMGDVERALAALGGVPTALLHCTVRYPAPPEDLNLRAVATMRAAFPDRLVGFSDHSRGEAAAVAAVALGARIIEKHFTLDKSQQGPDHHFSADPGDMARLVAAVRDCEAALGHGRKEPCRAEEQIPRIARRFVVAGRDLAQGEPLAMDALDFRRVDFEDGLVRVEELDLVLGMPAPRAYAAGRGLNWNHFKPQAGE